jgi:hypothetical protein
MLSRPPQATFLNRYLLAGERPVSGDRFVFVRSLNRIKNGERAYGVRCLMVGPLSPYRGPCQSRFRMSEDEMQTELRISFAPFRVGPVFFIAFPMVSQQPCLV